MYKKILLTLLLTNALFSFETVGGVWRYSMVSSLATMYAVNAFGAHEGTVNIGFSEDITMGRMNFKWIWDDNVANIGIFKLKLYKQVGLGFWAINSRLGSSSRLNNVIDFNPVYRLESKYIHIDYSLGASLMSTPDMGIKNMGGYYAYNHILNIGLTIQKAYLSLGYSHYSNNGVYKDNPGINFYLVNIGYKY